MDEKQDEVQAVQEASTVAQPVDKNKRVITILVIAVGFLIILVAVLLWSTFRRNSEEVSLADGLTPLAYDVNIALNEEDLQALYNNMLQQVEEGTMALNMKTEAVSLDGSTFSCLIANSAQNSYDMFIVLYLDETQEEIYRSGLFPIGGAMDSFTLSDGKRLESGTYAATLVYNQVEEDRATPHAQVNVDFTLIVQ